MSRASRSIDGIPLLTILEPGSPGGDLWPSVDDSGRVRIRSEEQLLFESNSFPGIRRALEAANASAKVIVPGDGGHVSVTDQRIVFVREKYDVGTFGKRGLNPVLRGASRALASARRGHRVAAGQVPFAAVVAVTYNKVKGKFGPAYDHYTFVATLDSLIWEVEVSAGKSVGEVDMRVIDAVAAAHDQRRPAPTRLPDGSDRWEYTGLRPRIGRPNSTGKIQSRPPTNVAEGPAPNLDKPPNLSDAENLSRRGPNESKTPASMLPPPVGPPATSASDHQFDADDSSKLPFPAPHAVEHTEEVIVPRAIHDPNADRPDFHTPSSADSATDKPAGSRMRWTVGSIAITALAIAAVAIARSDDAGPDSAVLATNLASTTQSIAKAPSTSAISEVVSFPPIEPADAELVREYLTVKRSLSTFRTNFAPLTKAAQGATAASLLAVCTDVATSLESIDPTELLRAAVGIPDPVLSELFIDARRLVSDGLVACGTANTEQMQVAVDSLRKTDLLIARRLQELGQ